MLFGNCLLLPVERILVLLGQRWDHTRQSTAAQHLQGFTSSCFAVHTVGSLRQVVAGLEKAGD